MRVCMHEPVNMRVTCRVCTPAYFRVLHPHTHTTIRFRVSYEDNDEEETELAELLPLLLLLSL